MKGVFPSKRYWIENHDILPVGEIDPSTLSKEINNFCGNYKILRVVDTNEDDMEKIALQAAKGKKYLG